MVSQGLIFTCSSLFQGLGNTKPVLVSSAIRVLTYSLPSIWLSTWPGFRMEHVWYLSIATTTLQAALSVWLLHREFGKRLAQEWASFPVLAGTKGAKRTVARGQSYYAGDGLNKSLVTPEKVEAILRNVLAVACEPSLPDAPAVIKPAPAKDGNWLSRLIEALANLISKWRK